MGTLLYGPTLTISFDDRVLAHLQLVIGLKLRRDESFYFSWRDDQKGGGGRSVIWIDTSIPLVFRYSESHIPKINREWLEVLTISSNSAQGLQLTNEIGSSAEESRDATAGNGTAV